MFKTKGFSLAEILVALMVIGIITASAMPLMTKMAQNKTGIDKNTIICIAESPAEWYNETDGTTELPAEGTMCRAAVTDIQHDRGKALETAKWYANNGIDSLKVTAKKLLRTACDRGGKEACDYFIYSCWKSGSDSEPYCDDEDNFLDLTYYLHQNENVTLGGVYVRDRLEKLLPKNIPNLVSEVNDSCVNPQVPAHEHQNLGNNIACELLDLNIAWWIKQCNSGNEFACKYCYDNQYNRSCHEVKSVWSEADNVTYRLTAKGDPAESGNTPVEVNCNMTSKASAAVSGCNFLVSGDCEAGYDNQYNRSCHEVKSVWEGAETGDYKLTANGDPGAPDNEPTIEVYCNMTSKASAAITGCGYNTAAQGPIPADEYVSGDCAYGRTENYNRDCGEIFAVWSTAPEGDYYNLTAGGDVPPGLASSICPHDGPPEPACGSAVLTVNPSAGTPYDIKVTKCNIADHGNLAVNGTNPSPGSGYTAEGNPKCWYGAPPGSHCDGTGCGNPVPGEPAGTTDKYLCNYYAGIRACHALNGDNPEQYGEGCAAAEGNCTENSIGWRLPTVDEAKAFQPHISVLDLCDYSSGSASPYCHQYSGCDGSHQTKCGPQALWAAPIRHYFYLNVDVLYGPHTYCQPNDATSIRCVRSKTYAK